MNKINKKVIIIFLSFIFIVFLIFIFFTFNKKGQNQKYVSNIENISEAYILKNCINKFYLYYRDIDKSNNTHIDMLYDLIDTQYIQYYNLNIETLGEKIEDIDSDEIQIDKVYKLQQNNNLSLYMIETTQLYKDEQISKELNFLIKIDNKNKNFSVFLNDYIIDNKYNNLNLGDEISISLKPIKENLNNKFDSVDESSISNINDIFDEYIKNCIFYEKRAYDLLDNECKENKYKTYQVFDEYITNNLKNIVIMKLLSYEYSKKEGYDEYKCITNKGYNIIFKVTSYITYTVNIE